MASLDALYDAVYAAPDDDAPRLALAAALAGSPRAELIALQLAAARTKPPRAEATRARRILADHADEWLAPLRGALVKRSIRWERGFPVSGQLAVQRTAAAQETIIGLPALATLRSLSLEPPNSVLPTDWLERFAFARPLRSIRHFAGFRRSLLPAMLFADPPFAVEVLEIAGEGGGGAQGERIERDLLSTLASAWADGRGLPRLREIQLSFSHGLSRDPAHYAWLWETETGRRIEQLSINEGAYVVAAFRAALEAHPTSLRHLVLFGRNHFILERTPAGWTRLVARPNPALYPPERAQLDQTLAALRTSGVDVEMADPA